MIELSEEAEETRLSLSQHREAYSNGGDRDEYAEDEWNEAANGIGEGRPSSSKHKKESRANGKEGLKKSQEKKALKSSGNKAETNGHTESNESKLEDSDTSLTKKAEDDNACLLSELLEGLPCTGDDCTVTLYIQMELYESATLSDWLAIKHRVVDTDNNIFIFTQIVEGLDHIHQHGIIHRDLKPSNIFITDSDVVKIGDFGLATPKLPDEQDDLISALKTDVGVGTMLYAAPEQLQPGIGYDEKADIFALGVILAEMYCPPFAIPMERICCLSKLREPDPALPCNISEKFPDEAALIKSMLSLDPAKRPSTGEILEHALIQEKVIKRRSFSASTDSFSVRKGTSRSCVNCARKSALIEQLAAQIKERDATIKQLRDSIGDLQDTVKRAKRREKRRKRRGEKD